MTADYCFHHANEYVITTVPLLSTKNNSPQSVYTASVRVEHWTGTPDSGLSYSRFPIFYFWDTSSFTGWSREHFNPVQLLQTWIVNKPNERFQHINELSAKWWSKMAPFCNCCFPSRRILLKKNRLLKFMLLISMALIACLHLVILPSASGGYNDECFMPDDKRRILRIMVQNISKAFNKHGVQYWLDYGEFLSPSRFMPSLAVPRNTLIRVESEVS